jgi:hypothetical protein
MAAAHSPIDGLGTFYVHPQNGHNPDGTAKFDMSKTVPAKFLVLGGVPQVDANPGGSDQVTLYSQLNPDGTINAASEFENTKNYLIVPANYDPSEASAYAASVNADIKSHSVLGLATGLPAGIADMKRSFSPGGGQDLQRGSEWGVPEGEVEPAFKDSTSWNLGFTVAQTMIPNAFAEIGGGALNIGEYVLNIRHHKLPSLQFGMDGADAKDFQARVQAAGPATGHGLGPIYKNMLGIGHWLHESIAPIKRPPGRSYGPHRPGNQANNSESTAPGSATRDFGYAHHYMAEGAGASADTVVPHAALSSFHQIGDAALGTCTIGTPAQGEITPGHLGFWALQGPGAGFHHSVTTLAPYLRNFQGFMEPHSPVGGIFENAMRFSPFMERDALPSMAPIGRRGRGDISPEQFTSHFLDPATPAEQKYSPPMVGAAKKIDPRALRGALEELLERQGRLPPSGASAFDPLLTPAWPGLQLPA